MLFHGIEMFSLSVCCVFSRLWNLEKCLFSVREKEREKEKGGERERERERE